MTFEEFGLSQPILRAVVSQGYTTPTPIQSEAIPHVLAGRDLLGCAQTGTGKTAAFALPILHRLSGGGSPPRGTRRRIRVLVLSPTRELAAQIGESFRVYGRHTGLRETVIFGGVGQQPQVHALQQGIDVVVATPGRLMDLINQGYVDLGTVETFVLDEADRMLDMGFLPDVRRITSRLPKQRQTLCFSATIPTAIEQLTNAILRQPVRIRIAPVRATTELVEQSVCFVPQPQKPVLLAQWLKRKRVERALVFTRTKHGADRVARHLNRSGVVAEAMHGNKSQNARLRILASFKSHEPPVLVATDVAARGIDIDNVSHVFNYDLPHEPETYVHRIGRTGRAGATGIAVAFCDHEERVFLQAIERLLRRSLPVDKELAAEVSQLPAAPATGAGERPRPPQILRRSQQGTYAVGATNGAVPSGNRGTQAARPRVGGSVRRGPRGKKRGPARGASYR